MGRRSSPEVRVRIMDAALEAFNLDGVRGVSADTIIERANVAKMTLYKHYPTKDALAAAYIRERSDRWMAWLIDRVGKVGKNPKRRLLALFDALEEWFKSDDYHGCPFHRAAGEFPSLKNPIHKEVNRNERRLRTFIDELVHAAGLDDRPLIVRQLRMLMGGAEILASIDGDPKYARYARQVAVKLIR